MLSFNRYTVKEYYRVIEKSNNILVSTVNEISTLWLFHIAMENHPF